METKSAKDNVDIHNKYQLLGNLLLDIKQMVATAEALATVLKLDIDVQEIVFNKKDK